MIVRIVCALLLCAVLAQCDPTPIVMWHGMGDSCCLPFSLGSIKKKLNESLPGVYVHSLKIGGNLIEEIENGYFMHPDKQVELACDIVRSDEKLADGFNAIGFSQGGQFLRALVQRCDGIKMRNLISLGGQHQGVYGLPQCGGQNQLCDYMRKILNHAAYAEWVQKSLVQATYWHDPLHEDEYKKGSTFLSDINNEVNTNLDYVQRLQSLYNFVMVMFANDTMVQPVQSEWFGYYLPGQSKEVVSLENSEIYLEDRLGLASMNQNEQLHFLSVNGNHLRFDWDWFEDNIIDPYLNN